MESVGELLARKSGRRLDCEERCGREGYESEKDDEGRRGAAIQARQREKTLCSLSRGTPDGRRHEATHRRVRPGSRVIASVVQFERTKDFAPRETQFQGQERVGNRIRFPARSHPQAVGDYFEISRERVGSKLDEGRRTASLFSGFSCFRRHHSNPLLQSLKSEVMDEARLNMPV